MKREFSLALVNDCSLELDPQNTNAVRQLKKLDPTFK